MKTIKFNITGTTKVYGLIGKPISHTFSPLIHNTWFRDLGLNGVYIVFEVSRKNLKKAVEGMKALNIQGFNVTIPHKEAIIKFLDKIDPLVELIRAANTIKIENEQLIGKNTDVEGALKSITDKKFDLSNKKALIVGAGGAARAICFGIASKVKKIVIVNRTVAKARKLAKELTKKMKVDAIGKSLSKITFKDELKRTDLIINATPIGMYPNINETPIPKEFLNDSIFVFDLIYNPLETRLLKEASKIGCSVLGGIDMLINQAALAFEWWNGKKPNINLIKNKLAFLKNDVRE